MAKAKRKLVEVTPELLKEYEELKREIAESRLETVRVLARSEEMLRWLRLIAASR